MDRRKVTLNYFQAELCLLILKISKDPVDLKTLKGVDSLITLLSEKLPPRPVRPVQPPEGAAEELFREYEVAMADYDKANLSLNESTVELLLHKEELEALRGRLRAFNGYNTSNDYARKHIVELAKIVGV